MSAPSFVNKVIFWAFGRFLESQHANSLRVCLFKVRAERPRALGRVSADTKTFVSKTIFTPPDTALDLFR